MSAQRRRRGTRAARRRRRWALQLPAAWARQKGFFLSAALVWGALVYGWLVGSLTCPGLPQVVQSGEELPAGLQQRQAEVAEAALKRQLAREREGFLKVRASGLLLLVWG